MLSRGSLTFDHVKTDNGANFLTSTLHYISKDYRLITKCLDVVNLELRNDDHTAMSTSEIMTDVLEKYETEKSTILVATTDTTNTMPATLRLLKITWLGCSAHLLQLSIKHSVNKQPVVKQLISRGLRIGSFFNSSTVGQAALSKHQKS